MVQTNLAIKRRIQNYLYTFASNGRSGHIQADTNGFMRVTGSHAGVGLCMSNADNEVFRIHKESWGLFKCM